MTVYKYVNPERVDVLRNGRVRFTQAAALNDLRMFAQPKAANLVEKDNRGFELYLIDLPAEVFAEIIFGHWMSQDKKGEIAMIAKEKYPQVQLYEAKINETDFDLDLLPYGER